MGSIMAAGQEAGCRTVTMGTVRSFRAVRCVAAVTGPIATTVPLWAE